MLVLIESPRNKWNTNGEGFASDRRIDLSRDEGVYACDINILFLLKIAIYKIFFILHFNTTNSDFRRPRHSRFSISSFRNKQ